MGYDIIFVGGGLSAALAVLALQAHKPDTSIALIERSSQLGAGHTWCFHARDVPPRARGWLQPLVVKEWPRYSVRFPGRTRTLASPYACISGERLHAVVSAACVAHGRSTVFLNASVRELGAHEVLLDDGTRLAAGLVIDARGPRLDAPIAGGGYQKFVGLELLVDPEHALRDPVLIDATVPQRDGLRFMYALPLAADRVLLEDTYFSESAALDDAQLEPGIMEYARELGLQVRTTVRRERGVLPMPGAGRGPHIAGTPLLAGYRGGFFHPVTGYSFPLAVRFAQALAESDPRDLRASALARLAAQHGAQLRFLFALTRAMFTWYPPERRYLVLEHFYRLPEDVIERFYAAELGAFDYARVLLGPAPRGISLRRALGMSMGSSR